ncbi:MAG: hypothetical protein NPIRA06_32090 [Nitrospirales bacterium]|nr:MAG: hypothetical protein NPIRA06_32090 [Nitrospirales bacterium]
MVQTIKTRLTKFRIVTEKKANNEKRWIVKKAGLAEPARRECEERPCRIMTPTASS